MQTDAQGRPILRIANQGFAPFVRNALGRAVLALPGRNVVYNVLVVTAARLATLRHSYVAAVLIQSRGQPVPAPCEGCHGLQTPGHRKAFPTCVRLAGHFGGSCGNCKWQDHAAVCSVRDQPPSSSEESSSSGPDGDDDDDDDGSEASWHGIPDLPPAADARGSQGPGIQTLLHVAVPASG